MSKYTYGINNNGGHYVDGPGKGLGFYGDTIYGDLTCSSEEEAKRAAKIANIAFKEGYAIAQYDIRKALGVK